MDVISNIKASRRSAPNERWVDINFNVTERDLSQIVSFEVYVVPTCNGRIRRFVFSPKLTRSSQLTVKYLKKDMSYKFKVQAVYSDGTISNDVETPIVNGTRSEREEDTRPISDAYLVVGAAGGDQDDQVNIRTPPEFVGDIRVTPENKNDAEDIVITWNYPKIKETSGYQITGFRIVLLLVFGRKKVEKVVKTVKCHETKCTVRVETAQTYEINVKMVYWDVDSDCMGQAAAEPILYTTAPMCVNQRKIKSNWDSNRLNLKWRKVARAKSYIWEIRDLNNIKMAGEETEENFCTWTRPEGCTSTMFKFQIQAFVTANGDQRYLSKLTTLEIRSLLTLSGNAATCTGTEKIESVVRCSLTVGDKIKEGDRMRVHNGKLTSDELSLNRGVAVKILSPSEHEERLFNVGRGEPVKQKMLKEAQRMLELINHANVVQYFHTFVQEDDKLLYIAMELCHPDTLADRIGKSKKLDDAEYCKVVVLHIARGIRHIHSKNICHRDIKPSNILFSSDERVVKISDFGFSKKICPVTDKISSTVSTGTDGYRAPETYRGDAQEHTNKSSDIFSLGLVCFNILTKGGHPFGKCVDTQLCNIKKNENMFIEGILGPDASLGKDLIGKMLNYKQEKRPSADEILKHPYFWGYNKVFRFFTDIVERCKCATDEQPDSNKPPQNEASTDQQNAAAACSQRIDIPLRSEFFPHHLESSMEALKKDIEKAASSDDREKTISKAMLFLEHCQELRRNEPISLKSEKRSAIGYNTASNSNNQLLRKELNELKLMRRREMINHEEEEKLKKYVDDLKQKRENDLDVVIDKVSKIIRIQKKGQLKNWKDCLKDELKLHKPDCSCKQFVDNAQGHDIFALIKYIRNKLTHFEDDKEKYGEKWMATQYDILNFTMAAIPELLPAMYNAMMKFSKEYFEDDTHLESTMFLPL